MRAVLLALAGLCMGDAALAQDRTILGYGRLFNNDLIGDGHDRWRTGSYHFSVVTGPEGAIRSAAPGEIL